MANADAALQDKMSDRSGCKLELQGRSTYAVLRPVSSDAFKIALTCPVASSSKSVEAGRPEALTSKLEVDVGTETILIEVVDPILDGMYKVLSEPKQSISDENE